MRKQPMWGKPAPGTVLGVVAIIIALGGSAYAIKLGKNSVRSKQIAPKAVKSSEIAPNAATGADVNEGSLATVPSATLADNAGQVDGHDAVCPAGTFLNGGVCFDTAVRFPMSVWAPDLCADVGGRLPSVSELVRIRGVAGIDLGPSGDGHWTDARYQDTGTNEAITVLDNGTVEGEAVGNQNQIRCAFELLR